MSSAPPAGGQEGLPEQAAGASDPALAAAVRIQRRRHAWGLATFWLIAGCLLCAGINSTASSNGTPSPSWFVDLTIGFGVAAVAAQLPSRRLAGAPTLKLIESKIAVQPWPRGDWARKPTRAPDPSPRLK
jgi:peptidoglycan/LPS O-acetylase OafA/YrhL